MASIVDYLKSTGQDSSLNSRADLAVKNGLVGSSAEYINLAATGANGDINTQLLRKLQSTPAVTPTPAPTPAPSGGPGSLSSASKYNNTTMTAGDMERGSNLPEPTTYVSTQKVTPFNERVSSVAEKTLTSSQFELDRLRSELQAINAKEQEVAKAKVEKYAGKIEDMVGANDAQKALEASNKKFKVEENIQLYSDIQSKLVEAQEALEFGLIYEKDRPARIKFITGAESTLMKQGLATIGALQGTAAVIKGNLDLARAFGDQTVNAITQDNEISFRALNVLLDLNNNELVQLKADEKALVEDRLAAIEEENARLQSNKDDVLNLMQTNPKAFLAGGVTLLDSKEQALQKMLPTMAEDEKALFLASISKGSTSTSSDKDGPAADKTMLLQLKNNGMSLEEAINAFSDTLSVSWIEAVYQKEDPISPKDAAENAAYGQFVNPDGSIKAGYTAGVDKDGKPTIQKAEEESDSKWWNLLTWF
jgi:hypothetical protein